MRRTQKKVVKVRKGISHKFTVTRNILSLCVYLTLSYLTLTYLITIAHIDTEINGCRVCLFADDTKIEINRKTREYQHLTRGSL